VQVKLLPQEGELYVLAQSHDRISKERALRRRQLKGLVKRLKQLQPMKLSRDELLLKLGAAKAQFPAAWRLARDPRHVLAPSVPEVRAYVRQTIQRLRSWGFELIKHDFTTDEIAGRWGFEMKNEMIAEGWAFADHSRTTAEIIRQLYVDIREAAGRDVVIIGCNTIGHLAAGTFELQRIGDDTSGREWSRTRKMGVNCLAFRAPQHGVFFAVDADCVGQTKTDSVLWDKNRQWLDLLP
jgi:alpha-galactosidase